MSKPYKIKEYSKRKGPFQSGPPRKPWKIILSILAVLLLVFLGISIYPAVSNYFHGKTKPNPLPPLEESVSENAASSAPPESTTSPEPETPPAPVSVQEIKGARLPFEVASDEKAFQLYLESLPKEINTLYFEGKDALGVIYYNTKNQNAKNWEAVVEHPVDLEKLVQTAQGEGYQIAVKLSAFSDRMAARGNPPENAIMHSSGVIWIDNTLENGGKPWLTPYSTSARGYLTDLVAEVAEQGVSMIFLEDVRFPNDPTNSAVLGDTKGVGKQEILAQFCQEAETAAGQTPVALLISQEAASLSDEGGAAFYGGNPMNTPLSNIGLLLSNEKAELSTELETMLKEKDVIYFLPTNTTEGLPASVTQSYILLPQIES